MGVGYYLKPVPATRTSIGPYVSLLHRISSLGSRGREKERGGDDRRGGKKSASKGIFIEWILKLMVATSDMLIRRASGFLITPDDGPRNNRRVIQIEDAPPARLLMRFIYVHPRFVSPLPPSVSLSFPANGGGGGEVILSKPREQTDHPEATGTVASVSCSTIPGCHRGETRKLRV